MLSNLFCEGKLNKHEKLELLKDYFRSGNLSNAEMIVDRNQVLKPILPSLLYHSTYYLFLGVGYALVLNMFVKMPSAFFVLPGISALTFGFYKFYEISEEKTAFVDRYEYDLFKKYCKKDSKHKKIE